MTARDELQQCYDERRFVSRDLARRVLAEMDGLKAEIERLMHPQPDDLMEIRHGWLVQGGVEPDFIDGYGNVPDTDVVPLMRLDHLPGWPGAERDAALAKLDAVRAWVQNGEAYIRGGQRKELFRILDGEGDA